MVGFIIAAILLPFVFKDKLMTSIKDYANDNINAVVDFSDANLSFFSSFPDIRISIDSLSVTGIDNFDGIALFKSNHTYLDINFMSLIRKGSVPKINSVIIKETEINVVIVDSLNANYLITKESTNDPYRLTLDYYRIENGKLTYQDNTNLLFVSCKASNTKEMVILHRIFSIFQRKLMLINLMSNMQELNISVMVWSTLRLI